MSTGFIRKLDPPHSFPFITDTNTTIEKPIPFSQLPAPTDLSGNILIRMLPLKDEFDALNMSGLLLWIDPNDSKVFVNNAVKDKSAQRYSLNSNEGYFSIVTQNNKNYIELQYPSVILTVSSIILRPTFTLFFIGKSSSGLFVFDASIISGLASGIYVSTYSANLLYTYGAYLKDSELGTNLFPVISTTELVIFAIGYNLTLEATPYRVNGINRTTSQNPVGFVEENDEFTTNLSIRAWRTDNTVGSSLLGEVLIFNRSLSLEETEQMEGYLAEKWNLQGNLPSTHPYKTRGPKLV